MMLRTLNRFLKAIVIIASVIWISSCSQSGDPWATKDISGLMPDLSFTLTEANHNKTVSAEAYRGNILLLYFGYTQCPDICSTTMIRLSNALLTLGDKANQLRLLFVSVDPNRDSLNVLNNYTRAFGPQTVGLRGEQEALQSLTKRYRVTYGYGKVDAEGNYKVSHSSAVYVFDRRGKARLLFRSSDTLASIEHDLNRLADEK